MRWFKIGWVALLVLVFIIFSTWYGGNGKPITAEEGAELVAQIRANYADAPPEERAFADKMEEMIIKDDGKEFYAVNLERLKQGAAADEADSAYGRIVFPLLLKRAGHPIFLSNRTGLMLGEYGKQVDRVAVVRYRSLRDLINMVNEPAMIAGSRYKFDALEHTEVFITRPTITFLHVRFVLALILVLLGLAGWKLISAIGPRLRPQGLHHAGDEGR